MATRDPDSAETTMHKREDPLNKRSDGLFSIPNPRIDTARSITSILDIAFLAQQRVSIACGARSAYLPCLLDFVAADTLSIPR